MREQLDNSVEAKQQLTPPLQKAFDAFHNLSSTLNDHSSKLWQQICPEYFEVDDTEDANKAKAITTIRIGAYPNIQAIVLEIQKENGTKIDIAAATIEKSGHKKILLVGKAAWFSEEEEAHRERTLISREDLPSSDFDQQFKIKYITIPLTADINQISQAITGLLEEGPHQIIEEAYLPRTTTVWKRHIASGRREEIFEIFTRRHFRLLNPIWQKVTDQ